jgi:hypothetical protein
MTKIQPLPRAQVLSDDDGGCPVEGQWYDTRFREGEIHLACCIHVGSNYATLKNVSGWSRRVHFDAFDTTCVRVLDPEVRIAREVAQRKAKIGALMEDVRELTARLGVAHHTQIGDGQESQALARHQQSEMDDYKAALVRAKTHTLPALFQEIQRESKSLATWMAASILPIEASTEAMNTSLHQVQTRIHSVELYAGLTENVVQVREGAPATADAKIHLLQRRCYMDEECLARYEAGGMDFRDIGAFDRWLARPENMERILPFPRTIVAFRVRCNQKERDWEGSFRKFISILAEEDADKTTYLYLRNGDQLFRIRTTIEWGPTLFADTSSHALTGSMVYAEMKYDEIHRLVSEGEYNTLMCERMEAKREYEQKMEVYQTEWAQYNALSKEEKKHHAHPFPPTEPWYQYEYVQHSPETVHYDDIGAFIAREMAHHNRLTLLLQGLLDRSPVFMPHPPWQLWTQDGFTSALVLMYDEARALVAGEKPNFEAYRAQLNASLKVGSRTVGQQDRWLQAEAKKESARRDRDWRNKSEYRPTRWKPQGNPGPGTIASVAKVTRTGQCVFTWTRERLRDDRWNPRSSRIPVSFTTSVEHILNVDAYTPGDYRRFFEDPRTRAEYLRWAPLLLEAEEYKAGNRKANGGDS